MKVLIINSPLFRGKNSLYDEDSLPPIGLGIIATILKQNGHDVELVDAVALNIPLDKLISMVCERKPQFTCTNIFTTNLELVKELVVSIDVRTHIIIGGLATQSLYPEIFKWNTQNPIDIVHGDGELITSDILTNNLRQTPVFAYEKKRFLKVDSISSYFVKDISKEKLDRSFFVNEPIKNTFGFNEANIITSRGCIYNCAFCAAARSQNKEFKIREKTIDSIVSEIEHLLNIYPGLQSIRVLDDLFLKNSTNIAKAINVFKNFNLQWRSMAHVQSFKDVSDETVISLKESKCNELFIGIESGSPKILKEIHKTADVDLIKRNISLLLCNGINVKAYFIFGFPTETIDDFEQTYSLARYLKDISIKYGSRFRTSVFQFRPYHGTELYHLLENQLGEKAFDKVATIKPNEKLSKKVGRSQFNFESGNYSDVDAEIVHDFIYNTTNLNSLKSLESNESEKNQCNSVMSEMQSSQQSSSSAGQSKKSQGLMGRVISSKSK